MPDGAHRMRVVPVEGPTGAYLLACATEWGITILAPADARGLADDWRDDAPDAAAELDRLAAWCETRGAGPS